MQEIGGLAGRIALAALALVIVSRRRLLRQYQSHSKVYKDVDLATIVDDKLYIRTRGTLYCFAEKE